jgi:release factor glutamine methyltransferase
LATQGVETARLDAEVLLGHTLGTTRAGVYARLAAPLSPFQSAQFWRLVQRRARREPLSYLTGVREFWSLDFVVTQEVLIPRPETELLVETSLQLLAHASAPRKAARIVDLGTGSGCIAIALATELPNAEIWALDISPTALAIAQRNAQRHGVSERIHFRQSDLLAALADLSAPVDLIVSNPPYIVRSELPTLQPEVRNWEPQSALDGGEDGLTFYRRLSDEAQAYLHAGGWLVLELGAGQAPEVRALLHAQGQWRWSERFSKQDYAGHERVGVASKVSLRVS